VPGVYLGRICSKWHIVLGWDSYRR
jgi:hypothetical protein